MPSLPPSSPTHQILGLTATPVSKATLAGTYAGLQKLAGNQHAAYVALDEADTELLVRRWRYLPAASRRLPACWGCWLGLGSWCAACVPCSAWSAVSQPPRPPALTPPPAPQRVVPAIQEEEVTVTLDELDDGLACRLGAFVAEAVEAVRGELLPMGAPSLRACGAGVVHAS